MALKETALIGATVITLAVGANQMLLPESPADHREQIRQQQVEDLSDAHERETDRMRDAGRSHAEAENAQKSVHGEHRPPVRLRIP
ncbi:MULTISPECIES: hypothetical protein [Aeromicrobium]|uniref:hypothetical protein n=1 Tax=Aeromicrobium TaxID=2040 RepID=UPI00257D1E71|nr:MULTISPECIES: hypothetical protein [Aeromicrobium]